jgi:hypothetical protein
MTRALPAAHARVGDAAGKRRTRAVPVAAARAPSTLEIGSVDDPHEHEADRIADQVMRMPDRAFSLTDTDPRLSRKCACEQDDEPNILQAKPAGPVAHEAPATVHQVLGSAGRPLDAATRGFFEPRFGRDFSDVRIHADHAAAESAQAINALGYTVGRDVVFAHGQYSPNTISGRRLLAHELAHVVQQTPSTPTPFRAPATIRHNASGQSASVTSELSASVIRRRVPDRGWHPGYISAGIAVINPQGTVQCTAETNALGSDIVSGNFTGRPGGELDTRLGNYASVCLSPCVGRPLNLKPEFFVDAGLWAKRPQPFDPPRLSATAVFYPDVGDPDVLIRETSTGQYKEAGAPLETSFGDFTFYTPESTGRLMVSMALADPSSGEVAVYSESIRIIECPLVATEPEPEPAEPEKPANGRQTRFNIEVQDPDNAPLVYQLVGPNTPLEGPGGFYPVWQDPTGAYYYLNNARRVDLPNFSPP